MAPYFFRSELLFYQFLELCFTSYPSPLEKKAPIIVKLLLYTIIGGLEYLAASWLADTLGATPDPRLGKMTERIDFYVPRN
jgi:hypothetical protein